MSRYSRVLFFAVFSISTLGKEIYAWQEPDNDEVVKGLRQLTPLTHVKNQNLSASIIQLCDLLNTRMWIFYTHLFLIIKLFMKL